MDALDSIAEDWLSYLQVEKGASVHTVTNYRRDIEGYIRALHQRGVTDLKAVTPDNVADYLSALSHPHGKTAPKAPSSIARALAAIRGFHRFAIREKYGAVDPTQDVHSPQMGERLPKALSIDEVTRLLDMAARDDSARGIRDHALLEVLYATGARVSEALAMAVDDIDLD
ncbi:MAG: site-specific integrase, partial [Actinomyces sp.]|nr:site-specific integrase [Actinomyces sp.]